MWWRVGGCGTIKVFTSSSVYCFDINAEVEFSFCLSSSPYGVRTAGTLFFLSNLESLKGMFCTCTTLRPLPSPSRIKDQTGPVLVLVLVRIV